MALDTNFVQVATPRFDGHYDHWSLLMENFLRSKKYWQVAEYGVREPAKDVVMTDAQKIEMEGIKLKDLKAKNYLFQAIDRPILEIILSKETSKDIWDSTEKKYQGSSRVKRAQLQALRRDFKVLQMKDGESVTSYCARTMEISNKMRFHSEKMEDVKIEGVEVEVEKGEIEAIELATDTSKLMMITLKAKAEDGTKILRSPSFADCSTVNVMRKGNVKIRTKNGFVETISNVLYVPDLKSILLSASQLQENGYIITIQQGACEIYDPTRGAIIVVEMSSNRLFPLKIESVQSCLMTEVKDSSWLWHFRFGHLSFGGQKTLQEKNMVTGLPQIVITSQVYEECVVGKQHRSQFPQGNSWRAKTALELVHSEICGPMKPSSNGRCIAYAHVPDEKRKKLDDKSEKCVFLGVSEVSKAYKLFNPLTKKIVTGRDVVFEEESTWDSDAEEKKQPTPMISMPENASNATPTVAETLSATVEATDVVVQSPRLAQKRPAWIKDYKVTGIDQDDLIYTGNDSVMLEEFKKSMMIEFEMSNLGMMHYFLGIEVVQSTYGIFISQKKYVREILDRYMENPTEKHLLAAKRIFRYLQGTRDFGLFYKKGKKLDLFGFTDSDYAGDQDDKRSTSGYVFMLGTWVVSWSSKKQSIVTLSTIEAGFVAATACACQAIWLRRILEELQFI
ncbi:hypothetical protein RJ639_008108 [Escallonia herrerae]|uniref:Uncharacterized protein n=1 Tax=Escallonia herrerae TaxID=1293975 RepID=A0AA88VPR7_9ASTE|nr:hypothetical protein RJ639_008108 [Escallonia herrerae]